MAKKKQKTLTNRDILESQGLVEIYDPSVGAYRQVPREEAQRMVEELERVKASMKGEK